MVPAAEAQTETVVYSFAGFPDGASPVGGLIKVKDLNNSKLLYGTTGYGGSDDYGTVFSVNPKTGAETVLYSFQNNGTDGTIPVAALINVNGTLYGTTKWGGSAVCGCGTVFSLNPDSGTEKVLYSFQGGTTDGSFPTAGVINFKGKLYGTTFSDAAYRGGMVFSVDPNTGAETVLHSFGSGTDGVDPQAGLIEVNGMLYGTTNVGGTNGGGAVFSLKPKTGKETVLYSFCSQANCTDGAQPEGGLINVNGTLYGTTLNGGTGSCDLGCGTVFSLNPNTGTETVIYSFKGAPDAQNPQTDLVDLNGTLYGTTPFGGTSNFYGAAFAVDPNTSAETVLHSFCSEQNCTDGRLPYSSLIAFKGALHGTTFSGGAKGGGTVFSIVP
jgi:uncharacterized repeat protein (TIGR03803 family)